MTATATQIDPAAAERARIKLQAIEDAFLIKACAHATRIRVIAEFAGTTDSLSPLELGERLNEPLGDVAYHVRILLASGLLTQTQAITRRGALQHYYRPDLGVLRRLKAALARQLDTINSTPEATS